MSLRTTSEHALKSNISSFSNTRRKRAGAPPASLHVLTPFSTGGGTSPLHSPSHRYRDLRSSNSRTPRAAVFTTTTPRSPLSPLYSPPLVSSISPHMARAKKMERVKRTLGGNVPTSLVFPEQFQNPHTRRGSGIHRSNSTTSIKTAKRRFKSLHQPRSASQGSFSPQQRQVAPRPPLVRSASSKFASAYRKIKLGRIAGGVKTNVSPSEGSVQNDMHHHPSPSLSSSTDSAPSSSWAATTSESEGREENLCREASVPPRPVRALPSTPKADADDVVCIASNVRRPRNDYSYVLGIHVDSVSFTEIDIDMIGTDGTAVVRKTSDAWKKHVRGNGFWSEAGGTWEGVWNLGSLRDVSRALRGLKVE